MKKMILLLVLMLSINWYSDAQMTTRIIRDSLFIPWEIVYGPDNHIWFTQKNGRICRLEPVSGHIDTLYHETSSVINNEGGMLGLALHPSFPTQPYVYVAYNYSAASAPTYRERIVRYTYSANTLQSPLTLLENIAGASIHNGCRLVIVNDKLFISTGDASNQANPQNLGSVNGKILRINLDGSIPADNPIAGSPVWSWGHRNAQGLVYANGKMYSSEHGPTSDDEVNIIKKGRNYGWPTVMGFCNTASEIIFCNDSNVVEPLMAWTPTIAVAGTDYYNHPMFPTLQNSLLMTTLKDEHLYQLQLNATFDSIVSATVIPNINFGRLRDICISPVGKIYISTSESSASGSNRVDKIIEIYDSSFTTNVASVPSADWAIYPNPAGDYVIIKIPSSLFGSELQYTLFNAEGLKVRSGELKGNNSTIPLKGIASGLYHLDVRANDGKLYQAKILKD